MDRRRPPRQEVPKHGKEHELLQKSVGTWIDGMVPHLFTSEGTVDAAGKGIPFTADALDPAAGTPVQERPVLKVKGADADVMTTDAPGPDVKGKKSGEVVSTRKKRGLNP